MEEGKFQGHCKDDYLIIFHMAYYTMVEFSTCIGIYQEGGINLGITILTQFPLTIFFLPVSLSLVEIRVVLKCNCICKWHNYCYF